uniref:Peptidase A1 domain-containing protein n=1 Tax=Ananas comosus var. bracteatus TaxID=296719 RepID=A0A6V7QD47_ANACO|nr:unnamed protein product [Ananas comosus var. bracteatus]
MTQMLLILILFSTFSPFCSPLDGARVEIYRIGSKGEVTGAELVRRELQRDRIRLAWFSANAAANVSVPVPVHGAVGEYLIDLSIGTPPVTYTGIADTGSDLVWLMCQPCDLCSDFLTPTYNSSESSTFVVPPCDSPLCENLFVENSQGSCYLGNCHYDFGYGDIYTQTYTSATGVLATETFTFQSADPVAVPNIGFGCGNASTMYFFNSSGIVGLGRGNLSLISQLGVRKFSYCLTSFVDTTSASPLFLGSPASLNSSATLSTPFVSNPNPNNTYYYLSLKGISLGSTLVSIPSTAFALKPDGSGGLIIDSGTTLTLLVDETYQPVTQAIESVANLPIDDGSDIGYDLCYTLEAGSSPPQMPTMTFHFDGADMDLPTENYMRPIPDLDLWCLTMASSSDVSVFGNFMQQNMHILYDLDNEVLSFLPAQCNTL